MDREQLNMLKENAAKLNFIHTFSQSGSQSVKPTPPDEERMKSGAQQKGNWVATVMLQIPFVEIKWRNEVRSQKKDTKKKQKTQTVE